jgi:uncharacterized membrane protein YedE/YeeE
MENFTPIPAFAGGVMIGVASLLLLLLNGRIAGISGILGGVIKPNTGDVGWRIAFLAGLVVAPPLYQLINNASIEITISSSLPLLIVGGLLVGFGTTMGSGCTSGHGVCGLGRLSPRSLVATLIFLGIAAITFFVTRHLLELI